MAMVNCVKLGKQAEGLKRAPYPGDLGQRIFENVSQEGWQLWMAKQTMLINENSINVVDPKGREFLETEMERFFFGDGGDAIAGYTPPAE